MAARLTQAPVLVLAEVGANSRLTQAPVLVLADVATGTLLTQAPVLVLAEVASGTRLTQAPVLVLCEIGTGSRLTQAPVLVLGNEEPLPPADPCASIDGAPFAVKAEGCFEAPGMSDTYSMWLGIDVGPFAAKTGGGCC